MLARAAAPPRPGRGPTSPGLRPYLARLLDQQLHVQQLTDTRVLLGILLGSAGECEGRYGRDCEYPTARLHG